jgi:hypothetical protein
MNKFLSALLWCCTFYSFSQTGKITGKIIDAKTGETLPGATAVIEGTTKGVSTDFDGNFSLNNVPAGKVNLVFSYISYDSKKFTDVVVKENDVTNINVQLEPSSSTTFSEVVIVVEMLKENNAALTLMQKNNISVSDGISAETIKRTPDRNTSDVLKRVSGATIQDNKFAIIRGLNDRYNAAYLNGAPLPSTESDRKAFSFDIFPSNMLDNLVIIKTARPDLPGEFAGGIIDITTKGIPDKNFISVSAVGGYNSTTTGKQQLYYKGGKTDWLGIDDGTRAMPNEVPAYLDFPLNDHKRAELAKQVPVSDWSIHQKKFSPNQSYQLSGGYNFKLKERDFFGVLASVSYNKTNNYVTVGRRTWDNQSQVQSTLANDYMDQQYTTQVLAGAMLNLTCKITENHSISSKNLLSVNSDDRLIYRTGSVLPTDPNPQYIKSYAYWFTQNIIKSTQLNGEHYLPKSKIRINWLGAFSDVKRDVPNLRRQLFLKYDHINDPLNPVPQDTMYQTQMAVTSTGPAYSGSMLWWKLKEDIRSFKVDISRPFKVTEHFKFELKAGGLVQQRRRTFETRQLAYTKYNVGTVKFQDSLLYLPEDQTFTSQNMGVLYNDVFGNGVGGFKLKDGTGPRDPYSASSTLQAAYLMADVKYKSWLRCVFGARVENYRQVLTTNNADYFISKKQTVKDTTVLDILPSVNLIFSPTDKQNIRLSYSRTLNRPEFRELAPFQFWDFNTEYSFSGNDTLQRATIDNYDLRYEIYPGRGQMASVSGFYKNFINPIEQKSGNVREVSYYNTKRAQNFGFELEYRIYVGTFFKNDSSFLGRFLDNLQLFTNYAYIKSKVDVSTATQKDYRPMQGQSPYVVNAGITYADVTKYNFSLSAIVNRFGSRIYIVGDGTVTYNMWESGRTVLDLQATKNFFKNRMEIRFTIKDVLAKKQLQYFYQNKPGDKDFNYNKNTDDVAWTFRYGTVYSLSLSYRF